MKKINLLSLVFIFTIVACKKPVSKSVITTNETIASLTETKMQYAPALFKKIEVNGINIAYREAGNPKKPTIVLLHGFPSSSHQYRKVFNQLANEFHLIAPDYPGFGNSDFPDSKSFEYTFNNLAATIDAFLEKKEINTYTLMIQDYGAPIGFRIATAHPERVTGIITQNGNIYEEGLGKGWDGVRPLWKNRNKETENALLSVFSLEGLKWQYTHGVRNEENINPDTWHLDYLRLSRPNAHAVNLDLFYDYQNNIKLYPKWQQYLRDNQPPLLIVWGKNDAFFPESGAEAFKKDVKNIDYNIYNTGHFALEEDGIEIINKMRAFMNKKIK